MTTKHFALCRAIQEEADRTLAESETLTQYLYATYPELHATFSIDCPSDAVDQLKAIEEQLIHYGQNWVKDHHQAFNATHRLDKIDWAIATFAGTTGALAHIFLVGTPSKDANGKFAGPLSNWIRDKLQLSPKQIKKLEDAAKVPYDLVNPKNLEIPVEGLSAYYHRLYSLGHDPFLGFLFGVLDIMRGTLTTIDLHGNFVMQTTHAEGMKNLVKAFIKQFKHLQSDVSTSMGLPVPLMSVFAWLGKDDAENKLAELVQGMFFEGYDFIHFLSMSIPALITELIVRVGYTCKRVFMDKVAIKECLPFSTDHEKNPKLGTQLFIAHASFVAINAGQMALTKNPLDFNYPEWVLFFISTYKETKWYFFLEPMARKRYLGNKLDTHWEELEQIFISN